MIDNYDEMAVGIGWALRVSVAFVFALTGADKFSTSPYWTQVFAAIGLGHWFQYFTGMVEIVGGLLFLVPPVTFVGAGLLVATMIGAMLVQAVVLGHPGYALFPGAYLLGVVLAFQKIRDTRRAALSRRRRGAG
jgi:uncharacterized membrane protein YphA (DoxX/SURF4 family)